MRKLGVILIFFAGIITLPGMLSASRVVHCPRPNDALEARWDWAQAAAKKQSSSNGYWIGYTIKHLMGEYTYFASTGTYTFSTSYPSSSFFRGESLGELVYGRKFAPDISDQEQIRKIAQEALAGPKKRKKIEKDVALLFWFASKSAKLPEKLRFSNLEVAFDPGDALVYWLDKADDKQSFIFLSAMYRQVKPEESQRRILSAVGIHSCGDLAVPFLKNILGSNSGEKLRGKAALEMGEFATESSLKVLLQTAKADKSLYVRKRAVSGLEDLDMSGATDALIDLAQHADERDVRRRAISSLGDIASRRAVAALEDIVYDDADTEVQKRAVYALEDLPNGEGIPYLIKIAKSHPKVRVRKSAIYSLGDSEDPRALNALIDIIRN